MKRVRGFSLVELLLVISILAMLAALLFPVLSRTKASAKKTDCVSNLRNLSVGVQLYRVDFDDRYPWAVDGQSKVSPLADEPVATQMKAMPLIQEVLLPYLGSKELWRCAMDSGGVGTWPKGPSLFASAGNSYWYQSGMALAGATDPVEGVGASAERKRLSGSEIVLFRDWGPYWHGDRTTQLERYNAVFLDGHARAMGSEEDGVNITLQF